MRAILISPYPDLHAFGIRTLSASLKQDGHDVRLLFLPKQFAERYENKTLNEVVDLSKGASLVGISLMTKFFDNAVQITQKLRESSDIPVLWGGVHPTVRPEECLNYADMVCIGEGEETILELAKRIEDGRHYHDIQGVWFRDKGSMITNQLRPLVGCLDRIPFPDHDYTTHFLLSRGRLRKLDLRRIQNTHAHRNAARKVA